MKDYRNEAERLQVLHGEKPAVFEKLSYQNKSSIQAALSSNKVSFFCSDGIFSLDC